MNNQKEIRDAACDLIIKSEVAALIGLVQKLAEKLGVDTLEGRSLMDYFVELRRVQLLEEIRLVADRSPALAASIQKAVDQTVD